MIRTGAQTLQDLERDLEKWRIELANMRGTPELEHMAQQIEAWIAEGERLSRDLSATKKP